MIFGKAAPKEELDASGLVSYLDGCFDGKLKHLSATLPNSRKNLERAFSEFKNALKEFSESDEKPNMEYLYGIKENYIESQKPTYTTSLLHIAASQPMPEEGANIYRTAENTVRSYNDFIMRVLKANSTFKLVMLAYAGQLSRVKQHFNAMERLCKELDGELGASSQHLNEYRDVESRIKGMLDGISTISSLKLSLETGEMEPIKEDPVREIAADIKEKEKDVELAKKQYNEANALLASTLLPMQRIARKYDYISASKKKLSDYIKDPTTIIKNEDDVKELNLQVSALIDALGSGKTTVKNSDTLITQLNTIKDKDLLSIIESVRESSAELKRQEKESEIMSSRMKELEKSIDRQRLVLQNRDEIEKEIGSTRARILSEKGRIEQLIRDYYKRQVMIKTDII